MVIVTIKTTFQASIFTIWNTPYNLSGPDAYITSTGSGEIQYCISDLRECHTDDAGDTNTK